MNKIQLVQNSAPIPDYRVMHLGNEILNWCYSTGNLNPSTYQRLKELIEKDCQRGIKELSRVLLELANNTFKVPSRKNTNKERK